MGGLDVKVKDVLGHYPIHFATEAHTTEDFKDIVHTLEERYLF